MGIVVNNSTFTRAIFGNARSINGSAGEITADIIMNKEIASRDTLNISLEDSFLIFIIFLSKYNDFFYIDSIKDRGNS